VCGAGAAGDGLDTGQHKVDANGELLFNLQVVALDEDGAQILSVKVPGDPKLGQGAMLRFDGLVAMPWSMSDRSGVAFRADGVESVGVAGGSSAPRQPAKVES
jgi:hypothetical protein